MIARIRNSIGSRKIKFATEGHGNPGAGFARNPVGGGGSCRTAESMRVPASRVGGSLALPRKIFETRKETKR
jgi:hypothetical protein